MDEFSDYPDEISVDLNSVPAQQSEGVEVFSEPTPPKVNEEVARSKAEKYVYAMGKEGGRTVSEVTQQIIDGYDKQVRAKAMAVTQSQSDSYRQSKLQEFMTSGGVGLDHKGYEALASLSPVRLAALTANPDTFMEKKLASKVADDTNVTMSDPDRVGMETYLTKQYLFHNIEEEIQARYDNESIYTKGVSIAKTFLPVYSWWTNHNAVKDAPTSSLLTGNNIKEQVDYLLSITDPDEAHTRARQAVEEMYQRSPVDALNFAKAITSYSSSDSAIDNAFNAFNVATGVTAGAAIRGVSRVAGAAKATIPGILDASGQVARAAWTTTAQRVANLAEQSGARVNSFNDIAQSIPKIANPASVLSDVNLTPFSQEYARRLETHLFSRSEGLLNAVSDVNNVARLDPFTNASQEAFDQTAQLFRLQYPGLNNRVLSVAPTRGVDNVLANTDFIAVQIGTNTAELFGSEAAARGSAMFHGLKDYKILPRGNNGWYIEVTKAVDETRASVRGALQMDTAITQTPNSLANRFMGWFRTRDELLPTDIARETKVATTGAEQLSGLSRAILEDSFSKLPKWRSSSRQDFMRYLENQRDYIDPTTQARGRFDNTIGQFYNNWNNFHGRPPTEQETTAYFAYTQVSDAEWMVNNLNTFKTKSRLGFENFSFKKDGFKFKVPFIEGRIRRFEDVFNGVDDDAGILLWDSTRGGQPTYFRKNRTTAAERANFQQMINTTGHRIIQLNDYGEDALRRIPGVTLPNGRIRYVIVDKFDNAPLSLRQVPYRPGGHVSYADNFFISQPNIVRTAFRGTTIHDYFGDRNAMAFRTREQATQFEQAFNHARELRRQGNNTALRAYLNGNTHLPFSYQDFTGMFDTARGGIFNLDTPFYVRTKNATVHQEHKLDRTYENFRDPAMDPHDPLNDDLMLKYATTRDETLPGVENLGSAVNPYYNATQARLLDPGVALTRSINQIARGRYLDDLKIKSAERFFQEFGDVLKGSSEQLQRFPLKTLFEDSVERAHPNQERVAAALNYQRTLKEFFNVKSEDQRWVDNIINNVAETVFNGIDTRNGVRTRVMNTIEPYMLSTLTDPTRFLRKIAFLPHMGFWNPKQLFLQAQGVVYTAALEGAPRALNGMALGNLMRPLHLRGNDQVLDHLANLATRYGVTPEQFKESYAALQRSGFQNVGGEYGTLDDVLSPTVVRSGVNRVMDHSLYFFKAGERINRLTAWNAAYLRWREANPIRRFDAMAQKEVLNRADLLTMNMTRASNASWSNGWASIPTQFMSYQARLMDQMLGGRLTGVEKARVVTYMSALYGVPLGVGGTFAGAVWPWHEQTRKTLTEQGYDVTDVGWSTFTNGIPQAMMSYLSEGEVEPAFAATFGPNGSSMIKDIVGGDKGPLDIAGGAAYKTISALFEAGYLLSEPVVSGIMSTVQDTNETLPLTKEDFLPIVDSVSTLSNGYKAYIAYTTGKYLTKNGLDTITSEKGSGWNAMFTGLLGTQPQAVADFYNNKAIMSDIKEAQKGEREQAIKFLRLAHKRDTATSDIVAYLARAKAHMIAGDFTERQKYEITREALAPIQDEVIQLNERMKSLNKDYFNRYMKKIMGSKE